MYVQFSRALGSTRRTYFFFRSHIHLRVALICIFRCRVGLYIFMPRSHICLCTGLIHKFSNHVCTLPQSSWETYIFMCRSHMYLRVALICIFRCHICLCIGLIYMFSNHLCAVPQSSWERYTCIFICRPQTYLRSALIYIFMCHICIGTHSSWECSLQHTLQHIHTAPRTHCNTNTLHVHTYWSLELLAALGIHERWGAGVEYHFQEI